MSSLRLNMRSHCKSVAFSPSRPPFLAIAPANTKSVCTYDIESGRRSYTRVDDKFCQPQRAGRSNHLCVAFSPCVSEGGQLLAASGYTSGEILLWDMQLGENIAFFQGHEKGVQGVAFSPDGSLLASGSHDCTVRLWDVATRSVVHVLHGPNSTNSVAFSPSGRLLASASTGNDRTVQLWNIPEGTRGPVLTHGSWVVCVAFSPLADSHLLASGGVEGTISLWDVSGASNRGGEGDIKLVREWNSKSLVAQSVVFSPDGSQLASANYIHVKLWSVASGTLLKTLQGHTDLVTSVAFHPNRHQLASAASDKTVRIWTICEWSDWLHYLFGPELKRIVFVLMCVKARQEDIHARLLPMQIWLTVFKELSYALDEIG